MDCRADPAKTRRVPIEDTQSSDAPRRAGPIWRGSEQGGVAMHEGKNSRVRRIGVLAVLLPMLMATSAADSSSSIAAMGVESTADPVGLASAGDCAGTTENPFADVWTSSYAYESIGCIYALGITTGTSATTYSPQDDVTRQQMASFLARLYRVAKRADAPVVPPPFVDMSAGSATHWDDNARIYGLGVTTGTSAATYSPLDPVTRQQMASFLARLYRAVSGTNAPVVPVPFVDLGAGSATHWDDIARIYGLGVTTGTSPTTYSPSEHVTREQMAAFLARLYDALAGSDSNLLVNEYFRTLPDWEGFLAEIGQPMRDEFEGRTDEASAVVTEWVGDARYECEVTPYSITANPREIVMFDPDSNILWTGALLQGDGYVDGIGSLQELPIRQRAPVVISLDLLTTDNMRVVDDPTLATVHQAVGELIALAESRGLQPAGSVFYEKEESFSAEQSALDLGLSARYMGSSVKSTLSMDRAADEHSVTAYFVEKAFTVSMVLPQLPGDVFSDEFTADVLEAQQALGRIGPQNLPVYVSNVTFGRILMFSMTSTESVSDMEATLNAVYAGGSFGAEGNLSIEQRDMLQNARIQVVTVGGNSSNALALIRSGELGAYFEESADLSSYRPISYTVRNLGDNSIAKVSETTSYNITECTAIVPGMVDVGDQVRITLDHVDVHSSGDDIGEGEVYGHFELDGRLVWDRSGSATLSLADGATIWFDPGGNTQTFDFYDGDGTIVYIDGQLFDEDYGNDDLIGRWTIQIREPIAYGRFSVRDGGATLVYRVEKAGDLYKMNEAPDVDAGPDLSAEIPVGSGSVDVTLAPGVTVDDGYPVGSTIRYEWTVDFKPQSGSVTFDHPDDTAPGAGVTLDAPGVYDLRLTAVEHLPTGDTELAGYDTVRVTVTAAANATPQAADLAVPVERDTQKEFALVGTDADGDPLTWAVVAGPDNGNLDPLSGDDTSWDITFIPNAGFVGEDEFTYTVNDGTDTSTEATVTITVS
jgi:hypothetical protein